MHSTHTCGHTIDLIITLQSNAPSNVITDQPIVSPIMDLSRTKFAFALPAPYTQQFKVIRRLSSINSNLLIVAFQQSILGVNSNKYLAN